MGWEEEKRKRKRRGEERREGNLLHLSPISHLSFILIFLLYLSPIQDCRIKSSAHIQTVASSLRIYGRYSSTYLQNNYSSCRGRINSKIQNQHHWKIEGERRGERKGKEKKGIVSFVASGLDSDLWCRAPKEAPRWEEEKKWGWERKKRCVAKEVDKAKNGAKRRHRPRSPGLRTFSWTVLLTRPEHA